jgi:hypothetical protein
MFLQISAETSAGCAAAAQTAPMSLSRRFP